MVVGAKQVDAGARRVKLEASWREALVDEFDAPYMQSLRAFLAEQKAEGRVLFPPGGEIFAALDTTPLPEVRVVIIGQDPYHGPDQAHGLCFSVRPGIEIPPSLLNIFREINADMTDPDVPGGDPAGRVGDSGYLTGWARQGVLLLNSVLTVERGRAGAHRNQGWEQFTDRVVELVNDRREQVVFLLWGSYAQQKGARIDRTRHCVLTAPHPSPLSAYRGFFGCRHFSKANRYLVEHGLEPIDWFRTS
ncbi:MAG TPA: uracil-DNA glycosylase [Pseudomonadales bacterium]|nr:uracil-DNA glycosylase [Pseudomonadales bacterium]